MFKNSILIAILTISLAPAQVEAKNASSVTLTTPPTAKQKELNKLFEAMNVGGSINAEWRNLTNRLRLVVFRSRLSKNLKDLKDKKGDKKKAFEKAKVETEKILVNFAARMEPAYKADMLKIYTHVYSKFYSEKDMKELAKFYSSSAGKKATTQNGRIIRTSMIKLTKEMRPRVEEIMEEKLFDLLPDANSAGSGGGNEYINEIME